MAYDGNWVPTLGRGNVEASPGAGWLLGDGDDIAQENAPQGAQDFPMDQNAQQEQPAPQIQQTQQLMEAAVANDLVLHMTQSPHGLVQWRLPDRYKDIEFVAVGGAGIVGKAKDEVTQKAVVIKKFKDISWGGGPFKSSGDALRSLREIKLLRFMRDSWSYARNKSSEVIAQHEDIIGMIDCFLAPNVLEAEIMDLYIVQEYGGLDLHALMQRTLHNPAALSQEHICLLSYQVVRALLYLHSAGIIHRDLKPCNIAVDPHTCDVKVLDFGMARLINPRRPELTGYVTTRYYRAPEVITFWQRYTGAVDMWSFGCVLAEILSRGRVLFAGTDLLKQLLVICTILGKPAQEYIDQIQSKQTQTYINSMPAYPRKPLASLAYPDERGETRAFFEGADPRAIDLLEKIFVYNPDERITAHQALHHPYFEKFHDESDEAISTVSFDDNFEGLELDAAGYFHKCCEEIVKFRQDYCGV